jgi:hypothetical protein
MMLLSVFVSASKRTRLLLSYPDSEMMLPESRCPAQSVENAKCGTTGPAERD